MNAWQFFDKHIKKIVITILLVVGMASLSRCVQFKVYGMMGNSDSNTQDSIYSQKL